MLMNVHVNSVCLHKRLSTTGIKRTGDMNFSEPYVHGATSRLMSDSVFDKQFDNVHTTSNGSSPLLLAIVLSAPAATST